MRRGLHRASKLGANGKLVGDSKMALVTGSAVFVVLLATLSGHLYSVDGLEYYRTADRMVTAGRITLEPPLIWGVPIRDPITPVGFSLALAPAIALALPLRSVQPSLVTGDIYNANLLYGDP